MGYESASKEALKSEKEALLKEYEEYKSKGLSLNMARGKPSPEQLDLSMSILDSLNSSAACKSENGTDCRNYGGLDGIFECKKLFADIMGVNPDSVFVGGNSSLNMMFDTISAFMTGSVYDDVEPWFNVPDRKFICPVPGYDRHFGVTGYYGFEMIPVPMNSDGPDMDIIEKLVSEDSSIKGVWCVPKYSNPTGITFSDDVVKRFANLKPAAKDFRIMWDNAYAVHDVSDTPDTLLNIVDECEKSGNVDMPIVFCSTSKITFSGAGVAAMYASKRNMDFFKKRYTYATIGFDKINMLRHAKFFGNYEGLKKHMQKHKELLAPKFSTVIDKLNANFKDNNIAEWTNPNGGYFVSVDVYPGTAKKVVELCKEAGVVLTGAGATFPNSNDPEDKNIRIAPSFPSVEELSLAMDIFCVCVKLAAIDKIL